MIAQIKGKLIGIDTGSALLEIQGGFVYEVLLPTFVVNRLGGMIGREVKLYTMHYLEGVGQGTSFVPRLAGFLTRQDKAFYELFTSVKGIGNRKALRAMALASHQIAGAILDRDLATLQSLPEIGKRTAETIVVTLKDKVESYITPAREEIGAVSAANEMAVVDTGELVSTDAHPEQEKTSGRGTLVRDALDVLVELGENRISAMERIDALLADESEIDTVDQVVASYYRATAR
ncbi:Holliday junction ATP-dependent DNA helicase RuvA [Poriferisphaera corsica]|uniref:Holliday junction branch migration complex subunit RuvA n=1 Tax=Poriferisphaera corsica TaxID=2528020 RepID=A0A517YY13_9BACT|nr:Holliday junction branch migration protein RuvA [Poriferisphaera corsica]QDU35114.1 Holliday junction ATP-dependent DNA helicase RuvA [Poriferisphaera corsica]